MDAKEIERVSCDQPPFPPCLDDLFVRHLHFPFPFHGTRVQGRPTYPIPSEELLLRFLVCGRW